MVCGGTAYCFLTDVAGLCIAQREIQDRDKPERLASGTLNGSLEPQVRRRCHKAWQCAGSVTQTSVNQGSDQV